MTDKKENEKGNKKEPVHEMRDQKILVEILNPQTTSSEFRDFTYTLK